MDWVYFLLSLAISGLIVGGLARLLLPGRESIGIFGTILAGLAGSIVGGLVGRLLFGGVGPWMSLALAVGGAILFILPYRLYAVRPAPVVVDRAYTRPGLFSRRRVVDPVYDRPAYSRGGWFGRRRYY